MNNVLDRIKSGESVVCDYYERESRMIPGLLKNEQATAELLALAERGARYRWVPVEERLPDDRQSVNICTNSGVKYDTVFHDPFGAIHPYFYSDELDDIFVPADVTHWMLSIPEPEEEEL